MSDPLTEADWKPYAKQLADLKIKDGGLQKALGNYQKLPEAKVGERERCLAILMKLTTALDRLKEVNYNLDLNEHMAAMIGAIAAEQEKIYDAKKAAKPKWRKSKLLTEADWKPYGKQLADWKLKDGGLQKALASWEKLPDDKVPERERCLAVLMKLTTSIDRLKEVNANLDFNEHMAGMISAVAEQEEQIYNAKKNPYFALPP